MNEIVNEVKSKLEDESVLYDLADLFKVLGDSTRTKILSCLEINELNVCDIASCLDMTKSAVSHQLRILGKKGFDTIRNLFRSESVRL